MMFFRVAIFVLIYEFCCVCGSPVDATPNHHADNIISKDIKNSSIVEIPIDDHAEIVAIQPKFAENTMTYDTKSPMKKSIPLTHHKKILTSIVHPLPRTMHDIMPPEAHHPTHLDHKKAHDDFLKHEGPKLQKKLHHHYTVEEMRQRRKELKEKWQARHNKLSLATPHGLHNKNGEDVKLASKHLDTHHILKERMNKNEDTSVSDLDNHRKSIADMYDHVTSRTRKILEHKGTEDAPSDSTRPHPRTTLPTLPPVEEDTKIMNPEEKPKVFQIKHGKRSVVSEGHPKSDMHHVKYTTESHFNLNYIGFPIVPDPNIAPMYYWPESGITGASTPSSMTREGKELHAADPSSESTKPMNTRNSASTPMPSSTARQGKDLVWGNVFVPDPQFYAEMNMKHEQLMEGLRNESLSQNKTRESEFAMNPEESDNLVGSLALRTTTEVPEPERDDVVSVKIDTSKINFEIYTFIPPTDRNMTHEEKFFAQKPVFTYGKSAEQVGSANEQQRSIDVHPGLENEQVTIKIDTPPYYRNLTHEEKILIQRPLWGLGKSAEERSIDVHPGLENEQVTIKIDTPPYYRNLTHEEKILIQRPLWGLGKSAEERSIDIDPEEERDPSVDIDREMSLRYGKRNLEPETGLPDNSGMKVAEENNQEWRETLREAVKERLRKLKRDSGESFQEIL